MKATLEDIANQAGVSSAIASTIIGGGGSNSRFSVKTRKRVLDVASRLNYRPRPAHAIGLIHSVGKHDPEDIDWVAWISPMLTGIHRQAQAVGKLVSVYGYSSGELEGTFSNGSHPIFRRRKVDGVILSGNMNEELLGRVQDNRLPSVLMNVSDAHTHAQDAICFDEVFTGALATRHLLELGHRRILHASVKWRSPHYSVTQRREGYENAMRQAGLKPWVVRHEEPSEFVAGVAELLRGPDCPTAIFAYSEAVALGCCQAMLAAGRSFNEVSLIGVAWNNVQAMESMGITAVHLPAMQMGKLAFEGLLRKTVKNEPEAAVLLRGAIQERQSTPPRKT